MEGEVVLSLPKPIARLSELAYNLWWSWHPDATLLFELIDSELWEHVHHNPVMLLSTVSPNRLRDLAGDAPYLRLYERVFSAFDAYMKAEQTWYMQLKAHRPELIAYFCAEYGLHESLPIYAGGLGVLAGDHCKTASDIGLPFVAVGLWYTQGYFQQHIDGDGRQHAEPETLELQQVPVRHAGKDGQELLLTLDFPGRSVQIRVLQVQVGRIRLFLLDTNVTGNNPADRAICAHLYGGDREIRIAQEKVLGEGGVHALRALGLAPTVWHMNEGHAAFMGIERMRELVAEGMPFTQAWPTQSSNTIFTTHTPVPAGNEVFTNELVMQYFPDMPKGLGLDEAGFLAMAHEVGDPPDMFAMTPLSLRLAHRANGVSRLHGAVARTMWAKQFPENTGGDAPITSITNGVHTGTWTAPTLRLLFDRYLGPDWLERVDDPDLWEGIAEIPDEELWSIHQALKMKMLAQANRRVVTPASAGARPTSQSHLNPTALTIGFARRFATYKRATLFFHDFERAARLLKDTHRPVQLVFAGKAHPADGGGQAFIQKIAQLAAESDLRGHVFFLEGYDIELARALVQGVDLWLNNPERPQEASGTSGQKAALNGVPNCSIRDGWWDEGYNGRNGWAFGGAIGNDDVDSAELYRVLEDRVIPAYYDRDALGLPRAWLQVMKESIRTIAPQFSAQRMVKEYVERLYF